MSDTSTDAPGIALTINGKDLRAEPGELLIDAAERHGVYIPRFCYHPRMRPVGMCRMCIVEVDSGRGPSLQPSCMLECTPDMVVETDSEITKKAQDGVLEFLLINHPLDCPVCDKGGECPLQDQTMAYGPGESRFVEEKRHFEKPIPISDLVLLDRERCILCDRCTRFADEVAGDPLISFVDRGSQTQVNTFPDHPFASYFSGNTVQICPVGALLAEPYRFRARPWDLAQVESTCQGCAVGCRVAVQTSRNEVLRYQGVDVDPVNWGWLCDKGRFGFQAVHSENRLGRPLVRDDGELHEVGWAAALGRAAEAIESALSSDGPPSIGVVGGSRLTNEDAYAWAKLAKGVLGTDNVDCQLGDGLPADLVLGTPRATIDEAFRPGGRVLLLGSDPKEELPVLYLRLRHAVREDEVTLVEINPRSTTSSELAAASLHPRPGELGALMRAIAAGESVEPVAGIEPAAIADAAALLGDDFTVIVGRASVAESTDPMVDAVSAIVGRWPGARFLPALRRANVHGALDMGLAPGILPGRVALDEGRDWYEGAWPTVPAQTGLGTADILESAAEGKIRVLVLLGADLGDFPDRDLATRALAGAGTVIALDLFLTESSSEADVVLPAAGFAECAGTTTNVEGRVSTLLQSVTPPGTARSDWIIASDLAARLGHDLGLESVEAIWDEVESLSPTHRGVTSSVLRSAYAQDGIVVPVSDPDALFEAVPQLTTSEGTLVHVKFRTPRIDASVAEARAEAVSAALDAAAAEDQTARDDDEAESAQASAAAVEAQADAEATVATPAPGSDVMDPGPADDRPRRLVFGTREPVDPPARDAYGLRLAAIRRLYDEGTLVQQAPSLAGLAAGTDLWVNPYDFDRLGVGAGDEVRVTSAKASLHARIESDGGVPRGAAVLVVNQPDLSATDLIDATAFVTDVRVETGAI